MKTKAEQLLQELGQVSELKSGDTVVFTSGEYEGMVAAIVDIEDDGRLHVKIGNKTVTDVDPSMVKAEDSTDA